MLYTTYFAKLKGLPSEAKRIAISQYIPKGLNLESIPNISHNTWLAPNKALLEKYKLGIYAWDTFAKEYNKQMELDPRTVSMIEKLATYIREHKNEDIFLICYEKDFHSCHRYLLALYLKEKYQIEFKEWENGDGNI